MARGFLDGLRLLSHQLKYLRNVAQDMEMFPKVLPRSYESEFVNASNLLESIPRWSLRRKSLFSAFNGPDSVATLPRIQLFASLDISLQGEAGGEENYTAIKTSQKSMMTRVDASQTLC